jgi:Protein of unknown function (DUF3768)
MRDTAAICRLNDELRHTLRGGRVMMTASVSQLPLDQQRAIVQAVRTFHDFAEDNDPHGEHDFGAVTVGEHRCFFKIDYYALDMEHGSDDPADPAKTTRVLTIMLAEDY